MKIQRKLKKLGIERKEPIDNKTINYIAHNISEKITKTFPIIQNEYNEILAKILNCRMYYAKIKENIAKVDYIYEDDTIYIEENIDILIQNEQLIHEIIHYLQVVRDNKGKIKKMGVCSFKDFSIKGLGINEAIVQYMSAKIMKNQKQEIQIYNLDINTISPNFYPILTNLIEELIYLIGEDYIIESSIKVNNNFEDYFYNTFEEKSNKILNNFDKILELKNNLVLEKKESKKIKYENEIASIYEETKNMMVITYYEKMIPRLTSIKELDNYTEKFLEHKDIKEYDKQQIMDKFDKQLMKISKATSKNTLIVYNRRIRNAFKKIISYFHG